LCNTAVEAVWMAAPALLRLQPAWPPFYSRAEARAPNFPQVSGIKSGRPGCKQQPQALLLLLPPLRGPHERLSFFIRMHPGQQIQPTVTQFTKEKMPLREYLAAREVTRLCAWSIQRDGRRYEEERHEQSRQERRDPA